MLSFLLGKYLGVEWMGHMIGVCLTLGEKKRKAKLFSQVVVSFFISTPAAQHLVGSVFLIWAIQVGVSWYLIVVLICIFSND